MTTTDAQGAVTTALMAACQDEDVDRVQELLAADKEVRLANWYHSCVVFACNCSAAARPFCLSSRLLHSAYVNTVGHSVVVGVAV